MINLNTPITENGEEYIPNPRVPTTHFFNKLNGMHLWSVMNNASGPHPHDPELFVTRQADFDHSRDRLVGGLIVGANGTYTDNFTIIDQDEEPPTYNEANLNQQAEEKITKKYPIVDQINVLARAIKQIGDKVDVELEELDEMLSYIKLCLDTNAAQKEFYRGNPDIRYVSDEDASDKLASQLEGGIHEWIGARDVTGGRVFRSGR